MQGNIAEENHYYSYGLKIAGLSSKKLGDSYEGSLKNNYLYQGAYSELDDDIGWTDFFLRNYDAQIGRWVQQDPFREFATPYTGMGNDPINFTDPSGGQTLPFFNAAVSGLSTTAETAITLSEVVIRSVSTVSKSVSSLSTLMKVANITGKVFQVANVLNSAVNTLGVGGSNPNYSIYQRCFAPWEKFGKSFGVEYHGDNRGFSLSDNVTSRIKSKVTISLSGKLIQKTASSDESIGYNSKGEVTGRATGTPTLLVTGPRKSGSEVRFRTHLWGANPLLPIAPPIEWMGDFTISNHVDEGYIDLSYQINGKGFPAFETFIEDPNGTRLFIEAYQTLEKGQAIIKLAGSPLQVSTSGTIRIFTDSQGNFNGTVRQFGIMSQIKVKNDNIINTKAAEDL